MQVYQDKQNRIHIRTDQFSGLQKSLIDMTVETRSLGAHEGVDFYLFADLIEWAEDVGQGTLVEMLNTVECCVKEGKIPVAGAKQGDKPNFRKKKNKK